MQRIAAAGAKSPETGVDIAQELLDQMTGMIQGAYIIPSFGNYDQAADVVAYLKRNQDKSS